MGARGPCERPRRLLALASALALLALLAPSAHALDECAMYSEDDKIITDDFWNSGLLSLSQGDYKAAPLLDTTDPGGLYYTFRTENIMSAQINPQTFVDAKYFTAQLVGDSVEIRTSQLFKDIEKDTSRDTGTAIYLMLELGCGSATNIKRLQLDLTLYDSNNWLPTAAEASYALSLPVPVPVGTALLDVRGVDYDVTGRGVEVRVEADAEVAALFGASVSAVVDRAFTVRLASAMEIRVQEPVSIVLRITDRGTGDEPDVALDTTVQVTFTPDLANSVFSPRFEQPLYRANVQTPEEVSEGGAVLAAPIAFEEGYADDLSLSLADGGAHNGVPATEFVEAAWAGTAVALRWKAGLDADRLDAFLQQPYALLVLTADADNAPQTGRTVVHLALPGAYAECTTITPPTECPTTCEDCSTVCTTTESPATTECPVTDCSTERTTITPPTECPTTCEDCQTVCTTTEPSTTTECPPTDCSTECTTITPPTDCPTTCEDCTSTSCPVCPSTETPPTCPTCPTECPTTDCPSEGTSPPTTEPPLPLTFEQEAYTQHLSRDDPEGALVAQPRLSAGQAVSGVRFALESEWESSPLPLLAMNELSGDVTLRMSPPPAGTFLYRVIATADNGRSGNAQLLVLGPPGVPCDGSAGEVCFANAVAVQRAKEEARAQVLAPLRAADDGCTFSALSGEYFDVDAQTGAAWVRSVDREDPVFGGAEEPVLRLALRMSCPVVDSGTDPEASARTARTDIARTDADAGDWAAALGTVPHDQRTTVMLVVVEDINDNAPVFEPNRLVVGFPDTSLAERLRLPELFTAKATDRDVGPNAELRYSLPTSSAAVLQVDAETGAVYPRSDAAPSDGTTVVVVASDQGPSLRLSGMLTVTLVSLSEDHLVELRVQGALPGEVEQLLADAAGGGGRDLRLLSTTVLPGKASSDSAPAPLRHLLRARRALPADGDEGSDEDSGNQETSHADLRVVLYSLRNDRPEEADQFKKEVEEALGEAGWEAKAEKPSLGGGGGGGSGGSDAGLLAAVITLAVLLGVLLVAAGVAGYWFGLRPRKAHRQQLRGDDGSPSQLSVVDIEPLRDDMVKKPPSPSLSFGAQSSLEGDAAVRPSVMLGQAGEHDAESDDYTPVLAPSEGYEHPRPASEHAYEELLPAPGPAPGPEGGDDAASVASDQPRKTVIFNEEVDCIEIRM